MLGFLATYNICQISLYMYTFFFLLWFLRCFKNMKDESFSFYSPFKDFELPLLLTKEEKKKLKKLKISNIYAPENKGHGAIHCTK